MSLAFQSFGSGPELVLLHGLFGSGDNLRVVARGLESDYRVILPDLPNHGASSHIGSSTHAAMADAVEEFLESESLTGAMLGGHSIGGKLAMLIALRHPDRLAALISIDMAPRRYDASHRQIIAGMRSMDLGSVCSRRDADAALASYVPEPSVRSFLLKNLIRDGERYRWRLDLDAIAADYDAMLGWDPPPGTYSGPALFVGGEHSTYLQADRDARAIMSLFPAAEIRMIPGAGHWLHADRPAEVLAAIRRFLAELRVQ